MTQPVPAEIKVVDDPEQAQLLLNPLRRRVLREAKTPASASEIARRLGESPQKVNYHVGALADAGLLLPAGETRKRNLVEKRYTATAFAYALAPGVLGQLAPGRPGARHGSGQAFSAARLIGLAGLAQAELGRSLEEAKGPVPTLSLEAEIHLDSPEQRGRFARALEEALAQVIARFTVPVDAAAPPTRAAGSPPPAPYRLVVGCYPLPRRRPVLPHEPERGDDG